LADGRLRVGAYSKKCEQFAGYVDPDTCTVRVESNEAAAGLPKLDGVRYNPFTGQLWRRADGGEISEQTRLFLPLPLMNEQGEAATPKFKIATGDDGTCRLLAGHDGHEQTLASCKLGDIDKQHGKPGYTPALGPGCAMITGDPTTVVEIAGKINREALDASGSQLVLRGASSSRAPSLAPVKIDGRFDEWRSRHGIVDPEGDFVSYLQYKPDTDLLELKVANDERHLYFYTRVAGRHGYTAPGRDRYYFYIYIDADRNPNTGYVPTRDDDCYYGVALGDDCEAQFEFVGGRFVKTFFGFAGNGSEKQILTGQVRLGPSWYNRYDDAKQLRDSYKVEIVKRGGALSITEDFTEGTSDDIQIALSPDGSECEMRVEMSGFLKDAAGKPIIAPGQSIDLAAGVEASGESDGQSKWSADSTAVWHGYAISAGDSK
jgi:hypothetical protein